MYNIFSAIVDVVALGIIVACLIIGLRKGFVKSFISSFGSILSIVLAILPLAATVTFLESQYSVVTNLSVTLNGPLTNIFGETVMKTPMGSFDSSSMGGFVASWLLNIIIGAQSNSNIPSTTPIGSVVSSVCAYYLVSAIALVVLFILFRIVFFLFGKIFLKFKKFTLVRWADNLLGFLFGLIKGVFIVQFVITLINFIPIDFFQDVSMIIQTSAIAGTISKVNLVALLISLVTNPSNIPNLII